MRDLSEAADDTPNERRGEERHALCYPEHPQHVVSDRQQHTNLPRPDPDPSHIVRPHPALWRWGTSDPLLDRTVCGSPAPLPVPGRLPWLSKGNGYTWPPFLPGRRLAFVVHAHGMMLVAATLEVAPSMTSPAPAALSKNMARAACIFPSKYNLMNSNGAGGYRGHMRGRP
jgi:hypothetical protein